MELFPNLDERQIQQTIIDMNPVSIALRLGRPAQSWEQGRGELNLTPPLAFTSTSCHDMNSASTNQARVPSMLLLCCVVLEQIALNIFLLRSTNFSNASLVLKGLGIPGSWEKKMLSVKQSPI